MRALVLGLVLLAGIAAGQQGSTIPLYPVNAQRTMDLELDVRNLATELGLTAPIGRGRWVESEKALYVPHGVSEGSVLKIDEDGFLYQDNHLNFNTTDVNSNSDLLSANLVMQDVDSVTGEVVDKLHWVFERSGGDDQVATTNYDLEVINTESAHTKTVVDYFFTRTTTGGTSNWVVFAASQPTNVLRQIGISDQGAVTAENAAWFDADTVDSDVFSPAFVVPLVVKVKGFATPGAFFLDLNSGTNIVYAQLKAGAQDNFEKVELKIGEERKQVTACVSDALYEFGAIYCAVRNANNTNTLVRVPALAEGEDPVRVANHVLLGPGGPITHLETPFFDQSIIGVSEADPASKTGLSALFAVDISDAVNGMSVEAILPLAPLMNPQIIGLSEENPNRRLYVTGDGGEVIVVNWATFQPTLTSYIVSIAVFVAALAALIWAVLLIFLGASAVTLRAVPYASNTYRWMGVKYNEFQTKRKVAQLKRLKNRIVQTRADVQDARVEVRQAENKRLIQEQERKIEEQERKLDEARKKQRRTQHFHGKLPYIVERLVTFLDTPRFLNEEGLFRLSGIASDVRELRDVLLDGEDVDLSVVQDPHTAAGALKLYFRENPEPLMTFDLLDDWLRAQNVADKPARVKAYQKVIDRLPRANRRVAGFVIGFLKRVSEKKGKNKMGPQNLATVFGPNFWRSQNEQLGGFTPAASILIDLIEHYPSFRW